MTITSEMLTPEFGFVEGAVVEVNGRAGRIVQITKAFVHIDTLGFGIPFESIKTIRPITGPMAIWNFIPDDIYGVGRDSTGWPEHMLHMTHPAIAHPEDWKGLKIELRPWWAVPLPTKQHGGKL